MKINLNCNINTTSYGIVSLNILRALTSEGHDVTLWPISDLDRIQAPAVHIPLLKEAVSKQGMYYSGSPSVRIYHQNMLASHVGRGPRIGFPFFELTRFRSDELNHLKDQDALIAASKWGLQVYEDIGLNQPKAVVPCGVDRSIFHEYVKPSIVFDKEPKSGQVPTVFLNCSKTEIRKGHLELLEAFNKAFLPSDNVALIMNWRNRFFTKEKNDQWDNLYKSSPMGDHIIIIPEFLNTQEEIAALYASADCGVFPSKAEGFGLAPLEMMSQNKPVIVTNYSGHSEFCNNENSLLISVDSLELAFDGHFFQIGIGDWAELGESQIDQMVEHMRSIHKRKQEGEILINESGVETAQQFSWQNSAIQLVNFLRKI